jgi:hypothetical protein
MGRFAKRIFTGLAAACLLAGGAFAQYGTNVIDDLEHGTNQNGWGGYWYFYNVAEGGIANAGPPDEFGPMSFLPTSGGHDGSDWAAVMKVGTMPPTDQGKTTFNDYDPWAEVYPEIAVATMLTQDTVKGMGSGFESATAIKFWARADAEIAVWFKVETVMNYDADGLAGVCDSIAKEMWDANGTPSNTDIGTKFVSRPGVTSPSIPSNFRTFNGYGKLLTIGKIWDEYVIKIDNATAPNPGAQIKGMTDPAFAALPAAGDLKQDKYWGIQHNFKKSEITRLSWAIKANDNKTLEQGTGLYIDDISVVGYSFVAPDLCTGNCGKAPSIPTGARLFTNFDDIFEGSDNPRENASGQYWYHYDDSEAGGGTSIDGDLETGTVNKEGKQGDVLKVEKNGRGETAGALIEFTFGGQFQDKKTNANVTGFAGIGTNLYDPDENSNYYNAITNELESIYFEYRTDGSISHIFVEVEDKESVAAANGEVYYMKVPASGDGSWKAGIIVLDQLVLPDWAKRTTALDKTQIAKIQFKAQGPEGAYGLIAIDNVYFLDKSQTGSGVRFLSARTKSVNGLRASYKAGSIGVNWLAPSAVAGGKIQLVNTKGRVVASAPIAKAAGNNISANFGAKKIPTGMYFVRVNAKDVNGKRIVQQAAVSVVK